MRVGASSLPRTAETRRALASYAEEISRTSHAPTEEAETSTPSAPRGAHLLIQALIREGVEAVFGYPGGAVLYIYEELWRARSQITHYLARHEQGAVHIAEGYARASGRVGVALVTSGPGVTNAITGIANAYLDSIPLIVIAGQVPSSLLGTDAFQEVDATGITRPCVKHNYLVREVSELASIVREAFIIARSGRPGPVLIDVPKDITAAPCIYSRIRQTPHGLAPCAPLDRPSVECAAAEIIGAKRPILYVGGGIVSSGAAQALLELAEELELPVTPTLLGLGGFPSAHPLCLNMLGMHGTYAANMAVSESDLLIAVGVRFDDRVTGRLATFAPNARIVHIDIDPANVGKNVTPHLSIIGDAREALGALTQHVKSMPRFQIEHGITRRVRWWKRIRRWQQAMPLGFDHSPDVIKPQSVIHELHNLTQGNAIVTADVGQHQMWAAQFYSFNRSRQWITSGGLGAMGFGLPAAIGAKLAYPAQTVLAIVGDGGFQMTNQELTTAVQYNLPIKVIVMNNGYLGMVRQWQEMFHDRVYSEVDLSISPDFVKLAEAHGAHGFRAARPEELHSTLKAALECPGVVVVDVIVAKEENVFPIVPGGADARAMILNHKAA